MQTVSLISKENATDVEVAIVDVNISDKVLNTLSEFVLDDWIESKNLQVEALIKKAEIIRGLALTAHLKNLQPMLTFYYKEMFTQSKQRSEIEQILSIVEKVFVGHYPDAVEAKDAGSKIFHFMLSLITDGVDFYKKNAIEVKCVVNGCCDRAINSHSISRAHNFRKGVNYYSLKARIRDEGKANSGIYLGRVISSNASTRHLFCAEHDKNLFLPIEGESNLEITNTEHMFLQNWRTFLWEKHSADYYIRNMRKELEKNPQLLNQRTLKSFKSDLCFDEKNFNEENKDIVYFALTFTNKTPILASFCQKLNLLSPSGKGEEQCFYFQLLHNNNNHCLIVSGFRTPEMVEALENLKQVYEKDSSEFWQKMFNFMPLKKNVYFNETFAFNEALTTKLKHIYLANKNVDKRSFMRNMPMTFSKKELFSFFGLSKVFTNI